MMLHSKYSKHITYIEKPQATVLSAGGYLFVRQANFATRFLPLRVGNYLVADPARDK